MTTSATWRSSPGGLGTAASSVKRSTTSEGMARCYAALGRNCADGGPFARARQCGADELAEERRRPRGPRLELGVELARHKPRVVRKLDDLDEPAFLERAGDDQAALDERRPVVVVDLVAMTVALVHDRLPVGLLCARFLDQLHGLCAEPHRPAEILDLLLLGQQV